MTRLSLTEIRSNDRLNFQKAGGSIANETEDVFRSETRENIGSLSEPSEDVNLLVFAVTLKTQVRVNDGNISCTTSVSIPIKDWQYFHRGRPRHAT